MPGDFGELTVNIGLGINFLAGGTFYSNSNDTLSYSLCAKGGRHRKHTLDDPPHIIDLINYIMFFPLFISVHVAICGQLCSSCHGDNPQSLMVLF